MSVKLDTTSLATPSFRPLLMSYLKQLRDRPLRTKMVTSASLSALQELVVNSILPNSSSPRALLDRIQKRMLYAVLVGAPMNHFMISWLQRLFFGQTSLLSKVLQILVNNLLTTVYLSAMALIGGARDFDEVRLVVRKSLLKVLRYTWVTGPISLAIAQRYMSPELWVPWFNLISFFVGIMSTLQIRNKQGKD
ncbi:hypothetical protein E4T50_15224 [Aureobasidium sp. EXF-12298]|nr:hypothetical protein E4T50_15224 [Aureobasidium sp. EXF-12298]KAI4751372.1 hypothetical protein E4T51_15382 [Aureobasidium sp. EXF-12344]KAI4771386.1 hypothetical protein E4T52_13609 [Aureobasidium sp. EXF-3400]